MKYAPRFIMGVLCLFLAIAVIFAALAINNEINISELEKETVAETTVEETTVPITTADDKSEKSEEEAEIVRGLRKKINNLEQEVDEKLGDNFSTPKNVLKDIIKNICNYFTYAQRDENTTSYIRSKMKSIMTDECYNQFLNIDEFDYANEKVFAEEVAMRTVSYDDIDTDNPKALVSVSYKDDYRTNIRYMDIEFSLDKQLDKYKVSSFAIA